MVSEYIKQLQKISKEMEEASALILPHDRNHAIDLQAASNNINEAVKILCGLYPQTN